MDIYFLVFLSLFISLVEMVVIYFLGMFAVNLSREVRSRQIVPADPPSQPVDTTGLTDIKTPANTYDDRFKSN
jgi:hypothetical protein